MADVGDDASNKEKSESVPTPTHDDDADADADEREDADVANSGEPACVGLGGCSDA